MTAPYHHHTLTDRQIMDFYNTLGDGTFTDAYLRYECQIALGERIVADANFPVPLRYPTEHEIVSAKEVIADNLNRRAGLEGLEEIEGKKAVFR